MDLIAIYIFLWFGLFPKSFGRHLGVILAATPLHAGGPVLTEDAAEAAPLVRSHNNRLVPILFGIAVAAILLGGGSDSPCNGDEPAPETGGC